MFADRVGQAPVRRSANHDGAISMLDSLRTHATGPVAKVLFAILVVSFAIWGIGDIFRAPHGGSAIARVAGSDIPVREVSREFDSRVEQLQQQFGTTFDRHTAASLGVMQQAVDAAVARRLVDAHAHDLKLTAADETVAEAIRQNPALQGQGGFDKERFQLLLRSMGMSESDYVTALRADLVRSDLIAALTGAAQASDLLTQKLVDFRLEQRRGTAIVVDAATIEIPAPTDEELTSYLKANTATYQAPEYRSITLLTLAPEDFLDEIEVSDADLQAAYNARSDQYRKPEQRKIEQLLAPDEATIKRAAELVAGGQSFAQVAETLKDAKIERSELGPLAKGDLPESLDKAVFALADKQVSEPVQTPFGWHLVRVEEILAEQVQPFDAVKNELRREVALDQATAKLPDFATRLDDELAAGTGMEAAAAKQGIQTAKLEHIDKTGHTPSHERLAADRLTPEMLERVFAAAQGETSLLEQASDGHYFMFRIDGIEPAHDRPLGEVRNEVEKAWRAAEQAKKAKARAEQLRQSAGSTADLPQLAKDNPDVRLVQIPAVARTDDGTQHGLDVAAIAALFAVRPGELAPGVVDLPNGAAIVGLEEIIPAKSEPQVASATAEAVTNSMRSEILGAYEAALRQRYSVSIDQSVLAQLMDQMTK